jgi:spermidine synthase
MAVSGFAGLGYQIVWTQQCALWLGHESAAVLAVVTAFFGGLAVGALALGSRIASAARPVRWYAGCELVIAAWSLLLAVVMPSASVWLLKLTGVQPSPLWQWTVAFSGTFFLLLPATAAMGATLPAMERVTAQCSSDALAIAPLYACNTFGAVIGVLAIAFALVPGFGLLRTTMCCVFLNILCAVVAPLVFSRAGPGSSDSLPQERGRPARTALVMLAVTGLLGIGYEVVVVRVLSQVAEGTVYTFAVLLATYLIGSAMGAARYARWTVRTGGALSELDDRLLCALSAACLIGMASLWFADEIKTAVFAAAGASMPAAIVAETVVALLAFGLPTFVMGAVFSHLSSRATACGASFGQALGANTLGAAAAPMVFGVFAYPALGPKLTLLVIAGGYLALAMWRASISVYSLMPAGVLLVIALWAPPVAFIDVPDGGHVVSYREGVMASVSVVEDAEGVAVLRIDNRQQEGSSATLHVDARQALLPLLLHPAPRHALFLGLGTGITASAAAEFPGLQVDAVELLPEVIDASALFTLDASSKANPRLRLIAADARRYVRASERRYDVIVSDNFHPARSGSGSLYTVEHFSAVRERLTDSGIFCQWLPLHQLDLATLRSIVQSFVSVYPNGWAMLASNSLETPVLGLVARAGDTRLDIGALRKQLANVVLPGQLSDVGIEDEFALLGSFVAGPNALRRFAGNAARNTDDHPIVAYRAPRITYAPDSLPRDRLITLLSELSIAPEELLAPPSDEEWISTAGPRRLTAYWAARDRFIESGRDVKPQGDVKEMLTQVREPLLSVLRISPDFRPAYDPLLRMAIHLAKSDTRSAAALLAELVHVQPARPEAELAQRKISGAQ